MNSDTLIKRLRSAHVKFSLRQLGKTCETSHETLRKLIAAKHTPNLTIDIYNKIDTGLSANGF